MRVENSGIYINRVKTIYKLVRVESGAWPQREWYLFDIQYNSGNPDWSRLGCKLNCRICQFQLSSLIIITSFQNIFFKTGNFVWNFVDFEFDNNLTVTGDHQKRIDFYWTDGGSPLNKNSDYVKGWLDGVTVTSSRSINTSRNVNPSISHSVSERCGENWNWFWQPHYGGMQTLSALSMTLKNIQQNSYLIFSVDLEVTTFFSDTF